MKKLFRVLGIFCMLLNLVALLVLLNVAYNAHFKKSIDPSLILAFKVALISFPALPLVLAIVAGATRVISFRRFIIRRYTKNDDYGVYTLNSLLITSIFLLILLRDATIDIEVPPVFGTLMIIRFFIISFVIFYLLIFLSYCIGRKFGKLIA